MKPRSTIAADWSTTVFVVAVIVSWSQSVSAVLSEPLALNRATDEQWQPMTEGTLAAVQVERRLYESTESDHFFIHARLTNLSPQPLGVDLRNYWDVIYPNQWGVHQKDYREVINEQHMIHEPLDTQQKEQLIADYHAGKLTMVKPRQAVEYYREFNASGRPDVDKSTGNYFLLSVDGRVFMTDGNRVEALDCTWNQGASTGCGDLVIPFPVKWGAIPPGSRIIGK